MAYEQEISRQFPAYFIFLLDQSGSMSGPVGGGGGSKSDVLADNLNAWIENMIVAASGSDGIKEYMDVSVIGYTTDEDSNPIIQSALTGPLAGRERVGVAEFAENVAREEQRVRQMFDEETGEILEIPYTQRIWVESTAEFGTPISSALIKAYELADEWTQQNPDCFPPIVINFSDGESTEGDPQDYADPLMSISTNDGNVLLFNCHLSSEEAGEILFPSSSEQLHVTGDPNAVTLFNISSVFPESMLEIGKSLGFNLAHGARGMAFNAEAVGIIKFLDMGTKVSAELR